MLTFGTIFLLYTTAVVSPGPNLILLLRVVAHKGRFAGVCVAIGIGVGALTYALLSLYGVSELLLKEPLAYKIVTIFASSYIVWLGINFFRSEESVVTHSTAESLVDSLSKNYFLSGLFVSLSNIKSIMFFTSIFSIYAELIKSSGSFVIILMVFVAIEIGWYTIVAFFVSKNKSTLLDKFSVKKINFLFGFIMMTIGLFGFLSVLLK